MTYMEDYFLRLMLVQTDQHKPKKIGEGAGSSITSFTSLTFSAGDLINGILGAVIDLISLYNKTKKKGLRRRYEFWRGSPPPTRASIDAAVSALPRFCFPEGKNDYLHWEGGGRDKNRRG